MLCSAVIAIPHVLNLIPFSSLAAILIVTGYKLTKPALFREIFRKGWDQFVPFVVTNRGDIAYQPPVGNFYWHRGGVVLCLKTNFREAITFVEKDDQYLVRLNKDISFLNKAVLRKKFEHIREGATVVIDGGNSQFIDADIAETIEDFVLNAPPPKHQRGIEEKPRCFE
jgi:MFS superfamily sulfate permease-like transporter